jgi:hypothetical protein
MGNLKTSLLRMLNENVTLYRKQITKTATSDIQKTYNIIYTFHARITKNKFRATLGNSVNANIPISTHLIFASHNIEAKCEDYITDADGNNYVVKFVDTKPGGVSDHHIEIYCDLSDNIT